MRKTKKELQEEIEKLQDELEQIQDPDVFQMPGAGDTISTEVVSDGVRMESMSCWGDCRVVLSWELVEKFRDRLTVLLAHHRK